MPAVAGGQWRRGWELERENSELVASLVVPFQTSTNSIKEQLAGPADISLCELCPCKWT